MSDDQLQKPITIVVSPRCLFNMEKERKIYDDTGLESYTRYQQDHENETLMKGPAFQFVKALENVNKRLRELDPDSGEIFKIVLMTNNCVQVGVRLIKSLTQYGLLIDGLCMTGGNTSVGQLEVYQPNLYLSADPENVREAIRAGIGAATMFQTQKDQDLSDEELRVAFDGDGVLFSNESEKIFQRGGLSDFLQNEQINENHPLAEGPLKVFFETLVKLQRKFSAKRLNSPIKTYLVTSRGPGSSRDRVLKTFKHWDLETDEAFFLDGHPKGPCLEKIQPHIFFDDQEVHITAVLKLGTIAAHVPWATE